MSIENDRGHGITFLGALQIAFIVLKLTNYIDWSWWWVLSPMWIPVALVVVGTILYILFSKTKL